MLDIAAHSLQAIKTKSGARDCKGKIRVACAERVNGEESSGRYAVPASQFVEVG
jgi:hypothetical protein